METLQITIKDPRAEKLLCDLAEMDLIDIAKQDTAKPRREFGWARGAFEIPDSFDDPLEYFESKNVEM